jgi:hypothetical protein
MSLYDSFELYEMNKSLFNSFEKIKKELDRGENSNFQEYLDYYNEINIDHSDTVEEIKMSFYEMAFCIEVRKTTKYFYLEREELGHFFDKFWRSQC